MKFCRTAALAAAVLLAAVGSAKAEGRWQFRSSTDPARDEARALIYYEPSAPMDVRLAFKCQVGQKPQLLLGFYSRVYEGLAPRLKLRVKFDGGKEFHFNVKKLVEEGVPSRHLHAGVSAEVHKLWFLSEKAIGYRSYGDRAFESPLPDLLRALRDGATYVEFIVPRRLGESRARRVLGPMVTAIPLRGSTRAVNNFNRVCGLGID